jgi:hypothetical protein
MAFEVLLAPPVLGLRVKKERLEQEAATNGPERPVTQALRASAGVSSFRRHG